MTDRRRPDTRVVRVSLPPGFVAICNRGEHSVFFPPFASFEVALFESRPEGAVTCQPRRGNPASGSALGIGSGVENSNALKGQNRFVVKNLVSPFQGWVHFHSDRIPRADPASGVPPAWAFLFWPLRGGRKAHFRKCKRPGLGSWPPENCGAVSVTFPLAGWRLLLSWRRTGHTRAPRRCEVARRSPAPPCAGPGT